MKKITLILILQALAVLILDQASKQIIAQRLSTHETLPIIEGLLNLVHLQNKGMAFGLMNRPDSPIPGTIFAFFATLAVIFLFFWIMKLKEKDLFQGIGLSFILGGAMGNLTDRIRVGAVIDFIDLYLGPYHWPAFNVADSAITIGAFWLITITIIKDRERKHPPTR